jgi:hypothetical protein
MQCAAVSHALLQSLCTACDAAAGPKMIEQQHLSHQQPCYRTQWFGCRVAALSPATLALRKVLLSAALLLP